MYPSLWILTDLFSDHQVHSMVVSKYTDAVDTVNSRFRGRKVLAGCVMIRGNDMSTAETIAVAAGKILQTFILNLYMVKCV